AILRVRHPPSGIFGNDKGPCCGAVGSQREGGEAMLRKLVVIPVLIAGVTYMQTAQKKPGPKPFLVESQAVYYQSWEEGEKKTCNTYSAVRVLSCDETTDWAGSFVQLLKNCAEGCPQSSTHAERVYAVLKLEEGRAKKFDAVFSKNPWPTLTPLKQWENDVNRSPDIPRENWECKKLSGKVTCKLED
ncbi:MAG TPA: hypothetical protein VK728_06120, partial [Candidatus Sulfotelmatobacter sp.]|nr:hypothetical protein [Candidatus Sulfotelmatobacter sp.]